MNWFNIVIPPLIGGIIGYGTNLIAIKMLFRPLKPVYIGRFRVPFTPGIVPRRKDELAGILGGAIVEQFFNADDLEVLFTSDSFGSAVADSVTSVLCSPETRLDFLSGAADEQSEALQKLKDELCIRIQASILKSDLEKLISEQGGRIAKGKFGNSVVAKVLDENIISTIAGPLAEQIEKHVLENGRSFIMPLIDEELYDLSREPVSNIVGEILPDRQALHKLICNVHAGFMKLQVRPIVESIDIGRQISDKVRLMDSHDVEVLVLSVVRRELRYVVLLGGFIGAVIGAVNIFI